MDSSSSISIPSSDSFAAAASPYFDSLFRRRQQKKMSITETYYLAHTARKKLTREASRADHDLRLLVGHANLLDSLMVDLADAEHEQERWFNQTVHGAAKAQDEQQPKHIQWATTTIVEEPEEDWDPEDASDLDSDYSDEDEDEADDDYDERDFVITTPPSRRRAPSPVAVIHEQELMEDDDDDDTDSDFEYDDAEDLDQLSLTRTPSRASQSPPELLADSDDDSEDDNLPPSPPQPTIEVFDEKAAAAAAVEATGLSSLKDNHLFEEQGYYVSPSPSHQEQTLIEAY
ncbi:hypothetical protein N7474_010757 [Penicillium riverlandense]|uniref:uncharacterized protein n=1 Tax=Penicillium riverlandense TaxID=1903569 RepID=UPI0025499497|nr:uncharacterized protein N7474_010757 [Penicillium riverlandense]KAJ5804870.1 hypothetical protein N7474_010757 [Penicillium riverlandense]